MTVSRAKYTVEYPADFMLIAAMNPCPCGYYGHPSRECVCSQSAVYQYMNRISGPVLDRIDLHVHVSPLSFSELYGERPEESSATIRLRVVAAGRHNRPDSPDCRFIATPRWEASKSAHSVRCLPNRKPCCAVPWNACTFRPGLTTASSK